MMATETQYWAKGKSFGEIVTQTRDSDGLVLSVLGRKEEGAIGITEEEFLKREAAYNEEKQSKMTEFKEQLQQRKLVIEQNKAAAVQKKAAIKAKLVKGEPLTEEEADILLA